MYAARSFDTLISYHIITRHPNQQDHDSNLHRRENLESLKRSLSCHLLTLSVNHLQDPGNKFVSCCDTKQHFPLKSVTEPMCKSVLKLSSVDKS
jgi:hypothetical protein